MQEGAGAKGRPWEGLAWGAAAGAPFQPGQVRLEGLRFQFRSAAWASGGPGRVQEGRRDRDGAAAKPDRLPMNGSQEQGQW